jgi:KDO2-lipid IV(A) lauroyltransferase
MSRFVYYQVTQGLARALPLRACLWLAERFGDAQWRRSAVDRTAVQTNLSLITGGPVDPFAPEVREVFRNFGRYLLEFTDAPRPERMHVDVEAGPETQALLRSGQGAMMLSAHLGTWELGAVALARLGHRTAAVVLPHADARINRWFDERRTKAGVQVIPLGSRATSRCLDLLRKGFLIGIVGDREFGPNGVEVSLFGRPALIPRGPALLSLRSGAAVIPSFMIREAFGRFRFYLETPIRPSAPASAQEIPRLSQRYASVIERYIRRFPTQWLMFRVLGAAGAVL